MYFHASTLLWRTRFSKIGKRIALAGILLLLLAGASPLGTALLLPLENRFPRWDSSRGAPTGIIVLGGVIDPLSGGKSRLTRLQSGSSRRSSSIIAIEPCASSFLVETQCLEARQKSEFAIRFLENLDIPRDRIELESRSRNTRENAVNTMQLVRPKPGERWLLITSAYHMPRAIGLFRLAGFPVEAYPVDWQTGGWGDLTTMSLSLLGGFPHLNQAAHVVLMGRQMRRRGPGLIFASAGILAWWHGKPKNAEAIAAELLKEKTEQQLI